MSLITVDVYTYIVRNYTTYNQNSNLCFISIYSIKEHYELRCYIDEKKSNSDEENSSSSSSKVIAFSSEIP